jgi:hypothetical protein
MLGASKDDPNNLECTHVCYKTNVRKSLTTDDSSLHDKGEAIDTTPWQREEETKERDATPYLVMALARTRTFHISFVLGPLIYLGFIGEGLR